MPVPPRIIRLSNWLYCISAILAYALPAVVIFAILRGWFDPQVLLQRFPILPPTTTISPFQATLVAMIGVLSIYPLVATFLAMRALFACYSRAEILSDACADHILRIGRALIAVAATTVLVPTLQLIVLSWNNAPGGRILSIGLDDSTLGFLLSGGMLVVIGWVMREAARAAAENAEFV